MTLIAKILLGILTIAYPFAIYFGLQHWGIRSLIPILIVIGCAHLTIALKGKRSSWVWVATCLIISVWTWQSNSTLGIKLYPVCISLAMLALFGWGLFHPPSVIQRFAELKRGQLSPADIRYTRRVTIAWCSFFAVNALIAAALSIAGSTANWALYNGLISYLLMAALFGGELITRYFHHRKQHD